MCDRLNLELCLRAYANDNKIISFLMVKASGLMAFECTEYKYMRIRLPYVFTAYNGNSGNHYVNCTGQVESDGRAPITWNSWRIIPTHSSASAKVSGLLFRVWSAVPYLVMIGIPIIHATQQIRLSMGTSNMWLIYKSSEIKEEPTGTRRSSAWILRWPPPIRYMSLKMILPISATMSNYSRY